MHYCPISSRHPKNHGSKHTLGIMHTMLAKLMSYALLGLIRLLTGSQARWYGCPPKAEQRIYFANHQSNADLVMIWAALPEDLRRTTRAAAAKDYRNKDRENLVIRVANQPVLHWQNDKKGKYQTTVVAPPCGGQSHELAQRKK